MSERLIDNFRLRRAAGWVRAGGVIAYPTEAVFGLGCDPADAAAVFRLLKIKRRPVSKGLILVAADWSQLQPWLQRPSPQQLQTMQAVWPGPVTWLVPAADHCPRWLTGDHDTLAVRVSDHPLVHGLCRKAGSALVSTSANVSDHPPARSTLEVQLHFTGRIDYLLPGPLGGLAQPSRIVDLASGRMIRP